MPDTESVSSSDDSPPHRRRDYPSPYPSPLREPPTVSASSSTSPLHAEHALPHEIDDQLREFLRQRKREMDSRLSSMALELEEERRLRMDSEHIARHLQREIAELREVYHRAKAEWKRRHKATESRIEELESTSSCRTLAPNEKVDETRRSTSRAVEEDAKHRPEGYPFAENLVAAEQLGRAALEDMYHTVLSSAWEVRSAVHPPLLLEEVHALRLSVAFHQEELDRVARVAQAHAEHIAALTAENDALRMKAASQATQLAARGEELRMMYSTPPDTEELVRLRDLVRTQAAQLAARDREIERIAALPLRTEALIANANAASKARIQELTERIAELEESLRLQVEEARQAGETEAAAVTDFLREKKAEMQAKHEAMRKKLEREVAARVEAERRLDESTHQASSASHMARRVQVLQKELDTARQQLATARDELTAADEQHRGDVAAIVELEGKLSQAQQSLEGARSEVASTKQKLEAVRSELNAAQQAHEQEVLRMHGDHRRAMAKAEAAAAQGRRELERRAAAAESEADTIKTQIRATATAMQSRLETRLASAEVQQQKEECSRLEDEIADLRQQLQAAQTSQPQPLRNALKETQRALSCLREQFQRELGEMEAELEAKNAEITELRNIVKRKDTQPTPEGNQKRLGPIRGALRDTLQPPTFLHPGRGTPPDKEITKESGVADMFIPVPPVDHSSTPMTQEDPAPPPPTPLSPAAEGFHETTQSSRDDPREPELV
eukprot:Sspe_Gene.113279::Locus_97289_Transcript_2_2_Confidence_0.667_Length_2308::g.113279::m.113279